MTEHEKNFTPRTYAIIHEQALCENFALLQKQAEGARVCCVVKADAYGHGTERVVRALRRAGADYFAVSCVEEAAAVRAALDGAREIPILILGYTRPCHIPYLVRENITQALLGKEYAEAVLPMVPRGKRLRVHIAVDTGMNRIGYAPDETEAMQSLFEREQLSVDGIFSHFYASDEPQSAATAQQYRLFCACVQAVQNAAGRKLLVHIANSAAISNFPAMHCDMVRAGISLYGIKPSALTAVDGLQPVMTLMTMLSHIHTAKAGEVVGYGAGYTVPHAMRIGTLPIGYADGYLRAYAGGHVLIRGKAAPLLGRICMDQCMVDLSEIPDAAVGDAVELFGQGALTADTLAARAGTIPYEVLCLLSKRVVRLSEEEARAIAQER